jgi:hypothetical protein
MEAFGGVVGIAGRGVANGGVPFCFLDLRMALSLFDGDARHVRGCSWGVSNRKSSYRCCW